MRILITGGAGFIASHIQDAYLSAGHEVAVVDSLITGKKENLNPRSKFYPIDINHAELAKVFEEFKPDVLNHHAAQMDVRQSVAKPDYDAQVNIMGLIRLLELSVKHQVKQVLFASSGGAIYGEQQSFPASETHATQPTSPYGLSKWVGEEYLKLYERLYGLKHVVLRYANVYGPRQNPHGEAGVVAIFCSKMLAKQNCTINGEGLQTRDYVYIEDVVEANLRALGCTKSAIFNIGTGRECSVNELWKQLSEISLWKEKTHAPAKLGEQARSVICSMKAKEELNWEAKVQLSEGLEKTFTWFKG